MSGAWKRLPEILLTGNLTWGFLLAKHVLWRKRLRFNMATSYQLIKLQIHAAPVWKRGRKLHRPPPPPNHQEQILSVCLRLAANDCSQSDSLQAHHASYPWHTHSHIRWAVQWCADTSWKVCMDSTKVAVGKWSTMLYTPWPLLQVQWLGLSSVECCPSNFSVLLLPHTKKWCAEVLKGYKKFISKGEPPVGRRR